MSEEKETGIQDKKVEFTANTSSWSDKVEMTIKEIGEQSKGFKWMHNEAAKSASFRHDILTYLIMFIGPLAGVLSTVSSPDNQAVNNTITVLSYISGLLGFTIRYARYDKKANSHKTVASKYISLEGNIRRQLSLYRDDRVNAGQYLEWTSTSFDNIFSSAPLLPDHIYENCVKQAKEKGIKIPQRYGEMTEVFVETTDNTPKSEEKDIETGNKSIEIVVKDFKRANHRHGDFHSDTLDLSTFNEHAMKYELSRFNKR